MGSSISTTKRKFNKFLNHPPKPSPFLVLPPELRLQIYESLLPSLLKSDPPTTPLLHSPQTYLPLLHTCRLTYHDLAPLLIKSLHLYLTQPSILKSPSNDILLRPPTTIPQLLNLEVQIPYNTLNMAHTAYYRHLSPLHLHSLILHTYHRPSPQRMRSDMELRCIVRFAGSLGYFPRKEDAPRHRVLRFVWGDEQEEDEKLMKEIREEVKRWPLWSVRFEKGRREGWLRGVVFECMPKKEVVKVVKEEGGYWKI